MSEFISILERLRPGYQKGGRMGDYDSPGRMAQRDKLKQKSFKNLETETNQETTKLQVV